VKLDVCYGTWKIAPRPGGHPCGNAYHALVEAGHDPEVIRSYGLGVFPDFLNPPRRREVKRLTGNSWVPVLITDDGTVVDGSRQIVDWARANPATASRLASAARR
jgi:Glutathione S-transferase, N-terminal domain